ncbi:MarR family transcriptional regulator [Solihabitans fulvus]|uniref:MarR family transcriptional regulator n=1 Tax=Solihabitans fulvus TaxID=1892852 RepID=A0A5B2WHP6_9PSEU|nr:MarR family transcriptional regulator [Solihabitans fulvus]KAA2250172.1 MarR family transcriptional regulator [Solihabitans fulvus]
MSQASAPAAPSTAELMGTVAMFCRGYVQDFAEASTSLDLTSTQAKALALLGEPTAMGELADRLSCDASNATLLVDRLERRGLVERHADRADRRVKKVVATAEGNKVAAQVRERMQATIAALDALGPEDRRTLHDLLDRLCSVLQGN